MLCENTNFYFFATLFKKQNQTTALLISPCILLLYPETVEIWKRFAAAYQTVLSLDFSLRAIYGTDDLRNALHGSLNIFSAEREIRFMFPEGKMVQTIYSQCLGG